MGIPNKVNQITKYSFGEMVVNKKTYKSDIIIFPEKVISSWWRKEGHSLHKDDISEVLEYNPEIIIIGCGASGVMVVPKKLIEELNSRGIQVIVEKTTEAYKKFNELVKKKRVVGCFHLTC